MEKGKARVAGMERCMMVNQTLRDVIEAGGDACMSKTSLRQHKRYWGLVDELSKYVDTGKVYKYLPCTVATKGGVNPCSFKKDSKIRSIILDKIISRITEELPITHVDVERMVKDAGYYKLTKDEMKNELRLESWVALIASKSPRKPLMEEVESLPTLHKVSVDERIRIISRILTPGQRAILSKMVSKGHAENGYAALCIALKWADEKMEGEI